MAGDVAREKLCQKRKQKPNQCQGWSEAGADHAPQGTGRVMADLTFGLEEEGPRWHNGPNHRGMPGRKACRSCTHLLLGFCPPASCLPSFQRGSWTSLGTQVGSPWLLDDPPCLVVVWTHYSHGREHGKLRAGNHSPQSLSPLQASHPKPASPPFPFRLQFLTGPEIKASILIIPSNLKVLLTQNFRLTNEWQFGRVFSHSHGLLSSEK